jgi:hypothetical protein
MTVAYIILLIASLVIFVKSRVLFLVLLPIILLLFDSGFTYFETNSIITYSKAFLVIILVFFNIKAILNKLKYNIPLFVFILYCIILIPLSQEQDASIRNSIKAIPPMLYYFLGIIYFHDKRNFYLLFKYSIVMVIVSIVLGLIGYLFDIGREFNYSDDPSLGTVGLLQGGNYYPVAIALTMMIVIIIDNIFNLTNFKKSLLIALYVVTYILIILTLRRTSMILPIAGLLTIMVFNRQAFNKVFFGSIIVIAILLFAWPLYGDPFRQRYLVREENGRFDPDFYKTENRFIETKEIFQKTLSFESVTNSLFGKNVFAGGWEGGKAHRMYHTDHAQIIATTGIVGFIVYLGVYISLFKYYFIFKKYSHLSKRLVNLNSLLLALIIITLIVGFNGSLFIVTFRTTAFLLIGALVGRITFELRKGYNFDF